MRTAVVAVAILALGFVVSLGSAEDTKDKAKHTIKEVMKIAHKDGLLKKVTKGEASKDEQKQLVELYKDRRPQEARRPRVTRRPGKRTPRAWSRWPRPWSMAMKKRPRRSPRP